MIIRRDHVAGLAIVLFGGLVLALSGDLPFGTPASPGPGMLPVLVVGVMVALAVILLVQAGSSPPLTTIAWDDLPHALVVIAALTAAVGLYTVLGFVPTLALLLFGLMYGVERMPLVTSLAVTAGMVGGAWLLLGTLLKTPLPRGIFGS